MGSKIYGVVLLATITCFAASEAVDGNGGLLSVRIVGNVFCDTCHAQHFSKNSYFISGASVAVECRNNKQIPEFRIEAKTNDYGQFKVELPPSIFNTDKQLKRCSATLLQNEEQKGPCKLVSISNSSSFTLKSKQGSTHTYSAGFFSYRPQSPFPFCSQDAANNPKSDLKDPLQSSKTFGFPPFFLPPSLPRSPSPPSLRTPPLPSPLNFPPFSFPFPTPPSSSLPFPFPFPTPPSSSLPFPFPFPMPPSLPFPFPTTPSLPFPFPFPTTPSLPFPFPLPTTPSLPFPFPFPTPPSLRIPKPVETPSIDPLPSIPSKKPQLLFLCLHTKHRLSFLHLLCHQSDHHFSFLYLQSNHYLTFLHLLCHQSNRHFSFLLYLHSNTTSHFTSFVPNQTTTSHFTSFVTNQTTTSLSSSHQSEQQLSFCILLPPIEPPLLHSKYHLSFHLLCHQSNHHLSFLLRHESNHHLSFLFRHQFRHHPSFHFFATHQTTTSHSSSSATNLNITSPITSYTINQTTTPHPSSASNLTTIIYTSCPTFPGNP